ncbi:MAG: hypothetical protein JNK89_02495 [Saprospiraceae bacterium]|nr:hypothetical protein [Saprospiraceae bacterium]
MFRLTPVLCLAVGWLACAPRLRTFAYRLPTPATASIPASRTTFAPPVCLDWQGYVPDLRHPEYLPVRYLRVNVHVLDNSLGNAHRPKDSVRVYVRQLLDFANAQLDTNINVWRAPAGTPVLPKGYRFVLAPQPGDDGIYFHYDDALYYFISQGKNQNNYDRTVIDRYGIGLDSIVNIFFQVHPPDSVASKTYRANAQGIALGTALKMAGVLEGNFGPEFSARLLNHEVGHLLGLSHAWVEDGCPDTEFHPNKCWEWTPDPPCRELATNNMMDYNAYQIALSPCQIGKVQAGFANERGPLRRCLLPTWCTLQPDRALVIADSVHWAGARDLEGHLTIAPGGRLRISCRVSLPPGGRITVAPGGLLELDGCRLHNACGKNWDGIFIQEKNGLRGRVEVLRPPVLENISAEGPKTRP